MPSARAAENQPVNICIIFGEYTQPGEIVTHVYTKKVKPDCALCFYGRKCPAMFEAKPALCLRKRVQLESARKEKGRADAEQ